MIVASSMVGFVAKTAKAVRARPAAPRVRGLVDVRDGTFSAYGRRLEITRGLIRFSGELDNPVLDIVAMRREQQVEAGVAVTGSALAPRIRLVSEPDLPDAQKLAWLVLGMGLDDVSNAGQARALSEAALALLGRNDEGLIAGYGVSIETTQQALDAIARPQIKSVQIIANAFRLKPFEEVMPAAAAAGVGIIVRIPLASGLLAAKFTPTSTFGSDDHRHYNRNGEVFDMGETFSGVPFEVGINAAAELAALAPEGVTPAQAAIRWLVDQPGVTTVIPGATSVAQAQANAAVAGLTPTTAAYDSAVHRIYDADIRHHVHSNW